MKCLDSTFLIDLMNGDAGAVAFAKRSNDLLAITPVGVHELIYGCALRNMIGEELGAVLRKLGTFKLLTYSIAGCCTSGQMDAALTRAGKEAQTTDMLVVAAMLNHNCDIIVTRDKDFKRIKGITVETY